MNPVLQAALVSLAATVLTLLVREMFARRAAFLPDYKAERLATLEKALEELAEIRKARDGCMQKITELERKMAEQLKVIDHLEGQVAVYLILLRSATDPGVRAAFAKLSPESITPDPRGDKQ